MSNDSMDYWFGVRSVCRHNRVPEDNESLFEERVVIIQAPNRDKALAKGDLEANEYCRNQDAVLLFVELYATQEEAIGDRTEVFSLMRTSDLNDDGYVDRFFNSGEERRQEFEE